LQDFNTENNKQHQISWIKSINPFFYVIIVLGIIFFLYQIIGGVLAVASGGEKPEENVNIMRLILTFGQFMFILAPTIFFTRLQTHDLKNTFRLHFPEIHLLLLALFGIILIQPILQGYMYLQDYFLNHLPVLQNTIKQLKDLFDLVENTALKIISAYSPVEFIVVVIVICVTPAICEEILFRGFVLTNLRKVAKAPAAIFLTSFLFALYHFQPFNIIPLTILGAFLGFVVFFSNSIYLGMICHFTNNFLASFYLYKYGKQDFDTPHLTDSEAVNSVILGVISLFLFAAVLYLFFRFRTEPENKDLNYE
jgi:membrane protease YdiL (CAAX protease family)